MRSKSCYSKQAIEISGSFFWKLVWVAEKHWPSSSTEGRGTAIKHNWMITGAQNYPWHNILFHARQMDLAIDFFPPTLYVRNSVAGNQVSLRRYNCRFPLPWNELPQWTSSKTFCGGVRNNRNSLVGEFRFVYIWVCKTVMLNITYFWIFFAPAVQVQGVQVCGHAWAQISHDLFSKCMAKWEIHVPAFTQAMICSLKNIICSELSCGAINYSSFCGKQFDNTF